MDKGGLQQVLLNLFMNSIQAMEDGAAIDQQGLADIVRQKIRLLAGFFPGLNRLSFRERPY